MNSRWSKAAALTLAMLYASVALVGHALHDHGCCDADLFVDGLAAAECSCDCGHCDDSAASVDSDEAVWTNDSLSGCNACLACALIAQLELAEFADAPAVASASVRDTSATVYSAPSYAAHWSPISERGPPASTLL